MMFWLAFWRYLFYLAKFFSYLDIIRLARYLLKVRLFILTFGTWKMLRSLWIFYWSLCIHTNVISKKVLNIAKELFHLKIKLFEKFYCDHTFALMCFGIVRFLGLDYVQIDCGCWYQNYPNSLVTSLLLWTLLLIHHKTVVPVFLSINWLLTEINCSALV